MKEYYIKRVKIPVDSSLGSRTKMYFFVLLNIYLCLGLVSSAPTAIYTTTDETVDKLENTIANLNDDTNLRLSSTETIYNDVKLLEETSTITPGDDLKGEETFYPVGGVWWGVRPIYGGWWGYKPGWHGWHRPHGGGHWGGHWGGQWGGGHWGGGRWR